MSNDGKNENERHSPEAFAMAAWGLLTIMLEKLKELDPNFDKKAIKLFDHLLGRGGADSKHETVKREARKIFEQMVSRDLPENRIAWRRFVNRLRDAADKP
jgi:hypothetical protein